MYQALIRQNTPAVQAEHEAIVVGSNSALAELRHAEKSAF